MSIENTYRDVLTRDYIKQRLKSGQRISGTALVEEVETLIEARDLSVPQFVASGYHVETLENASASKFNNTFSQIRQDVTVLYKEMLLLSRTSMNAYERWRVESDSIEKKLVDLEDRIENLLLLTQDTEGYFAFLVDNFTDVSKIDLDQTTARINLDSGTVDIAPTGAVTRRFLNDLDPVKDVSFRVRSSSKFIGRSDLEGSQIVDVFHQSSQAWWTAVRTKESAPVTCELTVKLDPNGPIAISRIFMELHDSVQSGPIQVTPLYSTDNHNFSQLPTNTFTQEVRTSATFSFSEIEAQWIKFILTKQGPDPALNETYYSYQFGFKQIAFYYESFDATSGTISSLISKPLSASGLDGSTVEFEKCTLDVCERVEDDTAIKYSMTFSDDPTVPITSGTVWVPISPLSRAEPLFPTIINVGDISEITIGDTETVQVSYDGRETDAKYVNPARSFQVLSDDGAGGVTDTATTASAKRYQFSNSNDRILNYQLADDIEVNSNSWILFRNVGEQGLDPADPDNQVRDIQRGWRFEDPWYSCVIEITNEDGIEINFGDQPVIIDDIRYTGLVGKSTLTGKTETTTGIHRIQVHKTNWKHVSPDLDTLDELKLADSLYPYNHKMLIEGYSYGSSYPTTSEKVYPGADLFAETLMKKVSVFDVMHNIASNDYDRYALDIDAPNTHQGGNDPTRIFLLKIDENNADFQNERFVIRFTLINQLRTHLRLRADLSTESEGISPALHSYKIKLG